MANPEDFAIQRDKKFLVRLIVALLCATLGGLWIADHIANGSTGWATRFFGAVSGSEP